MNDRSNGPGGGPDRPLREGEPVSEPPVKRLSLLLSLMFAAGSVLGLGAAVYFGMRELWVPVYLMLLGTAFGVGIAKHLRDSAFFFVHMYRDSQRADPVRLNWDFVLHEELIHQWIGDPRVREALVGLDGWTRPNSGRLSYWTGANLLLRFEEADGRTGFVRTFPFRRAEERLLLDDALLRLQASGVTLYRTELNLNELRVRDFADGYDALPKSAYDFRRPFELGRQVKESEFVYPYRTPGMSAREEQKNKKRDSMFFLPVYLIGLIVNFLLAWLWIPLWAAEPGGTGFVWSSYWHSGVLALQLFNLTLFIVAGRYWRGTAKQAWRPLRDAALVCALHAAGLALANLDKAGTWARWESVAALDLLLAAALLIAFAWIRIILSKSRSRSHRQPLDAEERRIGLGRGEEPPAATDRALQIVFVSVLAGNFLIAWLLLPDWRYNAESGGYEELGPYMLVTAVLLSVAGAYWRKEAKWLTPFYGVIAVFIVQFIGAMLGLPQGKVWGEALEALFMNLLELSILLYPIFALSKGTGFLLRKQKGRKRT